MTCSDDPAAEFEFITRPVTYPRQPFQLDEDELITYESRFFSLPAYSLLADKRLFTIASSHPIATGDVKLYINKDAGLSTDIEPSLAGDEYLEGTPHYADYIIDMRNLLIEVANLHAADSDWQPVDFFQAYMEQARATYTTPSATSVPYGDFVHPEPANTVPSGASPPGASGSIQPPGDGHELGAQQLMDIDMDEIQYKPIIRPSDQQLTSFDLKSIPTAPIFPQVIRANGSLPQLNSIDEDNYSHLGLGVHASGSKLLITGDALVGGAKVRNTLDPQPTDLVDPSIKLMTGSGELGVVGVFEGAYQEDIPWALYPAEKELCSYYTPDVAINTINASGRQALFDVPGNSFTNNTVLLVNISEAGTSGLTKISNWPSNYHATSGVDANGHAHKGLHVCNKLIYNLNGEPKVGFSPVNGDKVFVHYVGDETGSKGETWGGAGPKYANGDSLYGAGGIVLPFDGTDFSTVNWARTNNLFSPVSWQQLRTSALGPTRGIFGAGNSVTFGVADIMAGSDRGVITYKQYAQWGYIDQLVVTDQDMAQGGQRKRGTINYVTRSYKEGKKADGSFQWVELDDSPSSHAAQRVYYADTFFVNNIVSFFFRKKVTNGFVHANGDVYQQWSQKIAGNDVIPRNEFFAPIGQPTYRQVPATTRSEVIISIGFFPAWARRRYVTTNNQITIPDQVEFSPAKSKFITFSDDLWDTPAEKAAFYAKVDTYGAPVWDPDEGVNYIYFLWVDADTSTKKLFFAHMDTDFVIFRMNQVEEGVLFGRPVLLSI